MITETPRIWESHFGFNNLDDWPLVKGNLQLTAAIKAAVAAGGLLVPAFYSKYEHYVQQDKSEYTKWDGQSEMLARTIIRHFEPQAKIMGEELSPNADVSGEDFWAIDGIDGTTNFTRRIPVCNVTLAKIEKGQVEVGVVFDFLNKGLYYAVRGGGAYHNGQQIHASNVPFNESVITFAPLLNVRKGKGLTEGLEVEALWQGMKEISEKSRRFHREFQSGGLELAWVAEGKLEGYASSWTNPWDLSAGALLVEEAGGIVTNIFNEPWKPGYYGVIAGNLLVHKEMIDILKRKRDVLGKKEERVI